MIEFIRTSNIYLVQDKDPHLLETLRKNYLTFSAEFGGEIFYVISTIDLDLLGSINANDTFRIIKNSDIDFLKSNFEYISNDSVDDNKKIITIDEFCKLIGDIKKTGSIYFNPILK